MDDAAVGGSETDPEDLPARVPLTGNPLDRADALRRAEGAIAALAEAREARALLLSGGKLPIAGGKEAPHLAWTPLDAAHEHVFLGRDPESGAGRFARELGAEAAPPDGAAFVDLRTVGVALPTGEGAIAAEAKSLTGWHATHGFCARCGAATVMSQGGWRRDCPSCGAHHFPRTDPVVIMLVLHRDPAGRERVLVGRQPQWPERMHSLLAGYVEPGESIEEAVRRETMEEAGVPIGRVGYLATQPWPFPSTLMIGCWGEALDDRLDPDETEIESCCWLDRSDARRALAGAHEVLAAPRRDAIARVLIEAWATGAVAPLGPEEGA